MKIKKLSFEDFKENVLERKQIITILGGDPSNTGFDTTEHIDPIGPNGGGTGDNPGAGIANPKP